MLVWGILSNKTPGGIYKSLSVIKTILKKILELNLRQVKISYLVLILVLMLIKANCTAKGMQLKPITSVVSK